MKRILIHVKRMDSVPTKDACVLKEGIYKQGKHSGGSSNENMASDFSTPQPHESSVISKG